MSTAWVFLFLVLVSSTFLSFWRLKSNVLFKYWNCNKMKHWQKANWFFQTLYRKKYLILVVQIVQYYYWFSCNIIIFNFEKVLHLKSFQPTVVVFHIKTTHLVTTWNTTTLGWNGLLLRYICFILWKKFIVICIWVNIFKTGPIKICEKKNWSDKKIISFQTL